MNDEEYRECIIEMVNKITDAKMLRRIFLIVHSIFIRSVS